jgi:hypothetical protein
VTDDQPTPRLQRPATFKGVVDGVWLASQ